MVADRSSIPVESYSIDGGQAGKSRLDVLAEVTWPGTAALLASAGVPAEGRVLDLGCGGGHVSIELARLVGSHGSVLGIDLDAEVLDLARRDAETRGIANLEFRVGTAGAIDGGPFDLAYARFLLSHVADPASVVSAMTAALAPGGLVVVEDVDFDGSFCYPPNDAHRRSVQLYREVVRRRGGNAEIGPALPSLLLGAGLERVQVAVAQPVALQGGPKAMSYLTLERTASAVTAEGIASAEEVEEVLAELRAFAADPTTLLSIPRIVQSWGQLPP